ncbi:MAG: hypothetical protein GXW99_05385 [Clostridiales bacterium]|nr:hypothetical protein [Clostridiales bacterium]
MADYAFYTGTYLGGSIPAADFPRLAKRAEEQLARYKRLYTVVGEAEADDMAICAMADAMYYFETAQNAPQSASIGSVSSSRGTVDISPKAQAAELYRCAALYLDIYRGCG